MTRSRMPRRSRHERGQASVMIALMLVTFLSLFAFTVNTGLLINAKINLQNAADMAAYSGAATQARLLNNIAYLNYEMRRHYKKFLFRYYVVGNMFQAGFPGPSGPRIWSPNGDPSKNFGVPAVCISFNAQANDCQIDQILEVKAPQGNPLDAISQALKQQIQAFEAIRSDNCKGITALNKNVLIFWLFNTDPQLNQLDQQLQNNGDVLQRRILNLTRVLSTGMGLVPRNFILSQRIKTLQSYLNYFPPKPEMTLRDIQDLPSGSAGIAAERTQAAFFSAYQTLGEHVFTDFSMRELLPRGGDGANVANFTPIKTRFDAYYVALESLANPPDKSCVAAPKAVRVSEFPVGVYKDPNVLTYYAVQVSGTARLLFSPFGAVDLRLSAYAAAQPFGSRVGPYVPDAGNEFVAVGRQTTLFNECGLINPCYGVPNLPLKEADNAREGWLQGEALSAMYRSLSNAANLLQSGAASTSPNIGFNELQRGYAAAMAPNPYERGLYTIPNDEGVIPGDLVHRNGGDPFQSFFENDRGAHAIWAPVLPEGAADSLSQEVLEQLRESLGPGATNLAITLAETLTRYLSDIRSQTGDDDYETFNVVRIKNPLRFRRGSIDEPIGLNGGYLLSDGTALRASYTPTNIVNAVGRGRTGYSVKFVPFTNLLTERFPANNTIETLWTNDLNGLDPEQRRDAATIKH